ncbi:hypothetical protein BKA63DRAFT_570491 [Paraphoma chrysanthemicola]|nr:hypothetical protein BKA63DRAFT_570491 [Paraphoma chrysanthemicola]
MRSMLQDVCITVGNLDSALSAVARQCSDDVAAIRSLLRPFRRQIRQHASSKVEKVIFVLRKEDEIERRMESFRRNFGTLSLGIILHSVMRIENQSIPFSHSPTTRSLADAMHMPNRDDLIVIDARSNMAITLLMDGRLIEAEHLHRYVYEKRQRILGDYHHETIKSQANIAMTINEMGFHSEAETLYREALRKFEITLGGTHPDTLKTHTNLATALHDQGKYEEADAIVAVAIPSIQSAYGPVHTELVEALEFRAILLHCLELYTAAMAIAAQAYEQRLITCGYHHDDTQRVLSHFRDLAENCEEEQTMVLFPSFGPLLIA